MMHTTNLMDVPSHATRRIERYGVLALILFLTTFGVLYFWDDADPVEPAESPDTASAQKVPYKGLNLRSRASARLGAGEFTRNDSLSRLDELPLAQRDAEQETLALRKRERNIQSESGLTYGGVERRDSRMSEFFETDSEVRASDFDSPAQGVTTSGYVGRKKTPVDASFGAKGPAKLKMEYIVKSGDCLSVIAERELGSVVHLDRLREVNGLSSDSLRLGQRLILPHIGETAPVRGTDLKRDPLPSQSSEDSKEWKWVEVREGDSLWKIAARELGAGHRHDEITGWNQLNSDILRPGTQLRVQRSAATELAMGGEGR